jgi:hypothetical protein
MIPKLLHALAVVGDLRREGKFLRFYVRDIELSSKSRIGNETICSLLLIC